MANESISAHGTILSFEAVAAGGFVEIGELGDITDPGMMRNEFDVTTHNIDIDTWLMGVARREPLTFQVFWNGAVTVHNAMRTAMRLNNLIGIMAEFPDGDDWVGSGYVRQITRNQPVDGPQSAQVTVRLSGPFYLNGVLVGV